MKERLSGLQENSASDPYTKEAVAALLSEACIVAPYPKVIRESDINPEIDHSFSLIEQVVYTVRNIRGEMKLPPNVAVDIHLVGGASDPNFISLKERLNIISALVRAEKISMHTETPALGFASSAMVETLKVMIPVPVEMRNQEKGRLEKERERLTSVESRLRGQLENREFVTNAPADLVEKQKKALQQAEMELSELAKKLAAMN